MKTIYEVSTIDYGMSSQYGTFEDKAVADALCEQVNAFNKAHDLQQFATVKFISVAEPGDPVFVAAARYIFLEDRYVTVDICPSVYEHFPDFDTTRDFIERARIFAFARAGTSQADAKARLEMQVEALREDGTLARHVEFLTAMQLADEIAEQTRAQQEEAEASRNEALERRRSTL